VAVIIIGTLLPWASIAIFTVNGTQTADGKLLLVVAIGTAFLVAASARSTGLLVLAVLAGLGCGAISVIDLVHITRVLDSTDSDAIGGSAGVGLWLDALGSAVLVGALIKRWSDTKRA
jgi:hypothetical protein